MCRRYDHCARSIQKLSGAGAASMQDNITKSFVQRLITEQGFRESAQQVFKQTELAASNDVLQRCRALNACLKQGFTPPAAKEGSSSSSSDSDISSDSDCEPITSSLAACKPDQRVSALAEQETQLQQLPARPFLLSRPTPVRHAAAVTIQRWFRQHHNRPQGACSPAAEQTSLLVDDTANRQQQAALCIQTCWRKYQAKAQSLLDQFSSAQPPTALTRSEQESGLHEEQRQADDCTVGVLPQTSTAELGISTVTSHLAGIQLRSPAGLHRMSLQAVKPAVSLTPAASAVVQRAVERAQQVQGLEQQWLAAQLFNS